MAQRRDTLRVVAPSRFADTVVRGGSEIFAVRYVMAERRHTSRVVAPSRRTDTVVRGGSEAGARAEMSLRHSSPMVPGFGVIRPVRLAYRRRKSLRRCSVSPGSRRWFPAETREIGVPTGNQRGTMERKLHRGASHYQGNGSHRTSGEPWRTWSPVQVRSSSSLRRAASSPRGTCRGTCLSLQELR